jgi:hypothetical protein
LADPSASALGLELRDRPQTVQGEFLNAWHRAE